MTPDEHKEADLCLQNWARYVKDDWLEHHILIAPPPTSEGYLAPAVGCDEIEPVRMPVDEKDAAASEHVIIAMGGEYGGTTNQQCLITWYTRIYFHECSTEEKYKRLARRVRCSPMIAPDLLRMARAVFWDRKKTLDSLMKIITCKKAKSG